MMAEHGGRYSWGSEDDVRESSLGGGRTSYEASPARRRSPHPGRSPARSGGYHRSPAKAASLHLPAYVRRKLGMGQVSKAKVATLP